jgi:hypothetical protein
MAVLKAALGGKATFNAGYSIYPNVEDPNLKNYAMHKAWGLIRLNRVLDFNPITGDTAFITYAKSILTNGLFAVADIIELDPIISPSILVATYVNVITPEAGFNFTLQDRAGAISAGVPAIVGATAGWLLSPPGGTLKNYTTSPNSMLQLNVTGVGAVAFPTKLKISVGAVFIDMDNRQW